MPFFGPPEGGVSGPTMSGVVTTFHRRAGEPAKWFYSNCRITTAVTVLRAWLAEQRGRSADAAFPTINGTSLSHDALQYLLNKHLAVARRHCPSQASKHVTPHVLRHTLAMDLLQHGVDRSVIALWLGHESVETTPIYL
ncbi:MAG: hypothetical protein EOR93_32450 [Mesorhizobium sp.]|uniref:Tyr recombinase domain-containing protein n=2 Tax=Mesorhizobium TaxID=68287 RepID=A0AB36R2R2_9HYPH|nr:hypothetical protein CIT25_28035 [Mesorhizobium mediterraneum]RWN24202.1 MAG: hypothetical protein EOR95_34040 [Mesorhizobium sp.]RWN27557.1 MAG: hypothetical protein EOR96_33540 [Mesorhizobium sp.]RWN87475.1 MAG: hypothetical protein EOS05_32750 [Mesorhizobium sp.]RWO96162.1 MAG: hypothetical protein EOQ98_23695 [Mesorhizobium sp.]